MDNFIERLQSIMRDVFDDDNLAFSPELTASNVEGWDSFAHVSLIVNAEKEFNVKFSSNEVSGLNNIGAFLEMIIQKNGK